MDEDVKKILKDLAVIDKLYEAIRFVDPIKKKVIEYQNSKLKEENPGCYDFWGKGKVCDNCVSIRAFNQNQTFVKVEYSQDRVFMVTAIPIELKQRKLVIELLKDTTNSMLFDNGDYQKDFTTIYAMIDNLNNLALKDPLTGVYNRRYINEKLPIDLVNAALSKQSVAVIMADIDFFKKVNDTYGHVIGDIVLKNFAHTLLGCITRDSDWVSRYGGEEFLICLPGAGIERATTIAENMRKAVEENTVISGGHNFSITASFGVCSIKISDGVTEEKLISCADQMLYRAKGNGRNRVEPIEL